MAGYTRDAQITIEKNEAKEFIGKEIDLAYLDALITKPGDLKLQSLASEDLSQFRWTGRTLAALIPEKGQPLQSIDASLYRRSEPFWFATSSQSFPSRDSVAAAHLVAERIEEMVEKEEVSGVEQLMSDVAHAAYNELCKYYQLLPSQTEVLFDDNATLVTYQFLGMTDIGTNPTLVSSIDIGHTMKLTLSGLKAEELMYSFKPAADMAANSMIDHSQAKQVGPFDARLMDTFADNGYQTDSEFLASIQSILKDIRPKVFIIPTVTSSGRRLPFIAACSLIRSHAESVDEYNPVIILDDAQGCGRISTKSYTDSKKHSIWDYADAILMTGAKVLGALPGSSAMLINRQRFLTFERKKTENPLLYRARKYGFVSSDQERTREYNNIAPRLSNTSEIASLVSALKNLKDISGVQEKLDEVNTYIRKRLNNVRELKVAEATEDNSVVSSIITFHVAEHPKCSKSFRDKMLQSRGEAHPHSLPVTLPKLIETNERDYLRVALDPSRITDDGYTEALSHALDRIIQLVADDFSGETLAHECINSN